MSGPHTTFLKAYRGESYPDDEWNRALALSLRVHLMVADWGCQHGRSLDHVEALTTGLCAWVTDVMKAAGHVDATTAPTVKTGTDWISAQLKINERKVEVSVNTRGYIEISFSWPGSQGSIPFCGQQTQDGQQTIWVESLLETINNLRVI